MSRGRSASSQVAATDKAQTGTMPLRAACAVLASVAAAWILAGSVGLVAYPLRRALASTCLLVAALSLRPYPPQSPRRIFLLSLAVVAALVMVAAHLVVVQILAVALAISALAWASQESHKRILLVAAGAVAAFAVYRAAITSIPWLWLAADAAAHGLGQLTGRIAGRPLFVGSTFAGLDFLVLTIVLWLLWLAASPAPRLARAMYGFAAILAGHFIYLTALSFLPALLAAIPKPAAPQQWSWAGLFHKAVPWNVPFLACAIHLLILAAMFRWVPWQPSGEHKAVRTAAPSWFSHATTGMVLLMAVLLPIVTALYPGKLTLQGKKVVFYEKGFLNWLKPEHGQYGRLSSGMYGVLPDYIESLGGKAVISADLSKEDLRDADALILIFPDEPWALGQLDRIWDFARQGGSLLVMGEHTTQDKDGRSRFNEVLEPTTMRVCFDSATFAVGGWLQSYEGIAHPMTAGLRDDQNQFGIVIGASMQTRWPARPLIIGRWGWSDWGDEGSSRAMMGDDRYGPGEKLGDLVLAAEQPFGKGRIVAFGDTSSLTNGINVGSHVFTSRLFGYLAGGSAKPHPAWRQLLGVLLCLSLIGLLVIRTDIRQVALTTLVLAGSLVVCSAISYRAGEILPDGRRKAPNNLAYIDSSHLESCSGESWRPDGVGGLALTLMRNGYLTLNLPELTSERLSRAGLVISVAPSREFSKRERAAVKDFIAAGGAFVLTAGYERLHGARSLLSDFGFKVGLAEPNILDPEAMGHFKSPYLRSDTQQVYARFHAGWPIACSDPKAEVIAYGRGNLPIIIMLRFGTGKFIVIGDACFPSNRNLEWEGGEPFEGMRENADFWRWFITRIRDEQMWIPPALEAGQTGEDAKTSDKSE